MLRFCRTLVHLAHTTHGAGNGVGEGILHRLGQYDREFGRKRRDHLLRHASIGHYDVRPRYVDARLNPKSAAMASSWNTAGIMRRPPQPPMPIVAPSPVMTAGA